MDKYEPSTMSLASVLLVPAEFSATQEYFPSSFTSVELMESLWMPSAVDSMETLDDCSILVCKDISKHSNRWIGYRLMEPRYCWLRFSIHFALEHHLIRGADLLVCQLNSELWSLTRWFVERFYNK